MSQTTNDNNDDAWKTCTPSEYFDDRVADRIDLDGEIELAEPDIPRDEFVENLKQQLKKHAFKRNENSEDEYITDEVIEKTDIEELITYLKYLFKPQGPRYCELNDGHLQITIKDITAWHHTIEKEFIGDSIGSEDYENLGKAMFNAFRETHHDNIHKYRHKLPDKIRAWNIVHKIKDED